MAILAQAQFDRMRAHGLHHLDRAGIETGTDSDGHSFLPDNCVVRDCTYAGTDGKRQQKARCQKNEIVGDLPKR
jgi:hypothetical protein